MRHPLLLALLLAPPLTGCPPGDDDDSTDDDDAAGGCVGSTITMSDSGTPFFEQAYLCWDPTLGTCATGEGTDRCAGVTVIFRYRADFEANVDHPAYAVPEPPWVLESGSPGTEVNAGQEFSELAEWPDGSQVTATFSNTDTADTLTLQFQNTGRDIELLAVGP